jgi:hypothetical protein
MMSSPFKPAQRWTRLGARCSRRLDALPALAPAPALHAQAIADAAAAHRHGVIAATPLTR